MQIMIPADRVVSLEEPSGFSSFSVRAADADDGAVLDALGARGKTASEEHHVYVTVDAVRALAAEALGELTPDWESGFAAMLDAAASHGWLDDSRTAIKAHIEPV